jgi:outer membrane protein assembly factor BamB
MRRWLVSLALAVVATPVAADAENLRVELASHTITTSTTAPQPCCDPRVSRLPASIEVDLGAVTVTTGARKIRHEIGHADGLSWIVGVGSRVVIGYAQRSGGHADSIVAIDHVTGALAWRRRVDSLFAVELVGNLIAIERAGTLDIVDARSGKTVGTTPLAGQSIQAVCRPGRGDLHLKTHGDLVAIDRTTGAVRWVQPATSIGNAAVTTGAVVDAWVDRTTHRFGIVTYDPSTGRRLDSIDLGATGGWYDFERVELAPDGSREVLVSAMFAVA